MSQKKKTTEKETRHQRRRDSLHCRRVKCNKFWQKDTGKTKQITNWTVSAFKGNLRFSVLKLFWKCKTRAFSRKIEIKPIPILLNISLTENNHFWYCCPFFASDFQDFMHNSTGYVVKQFVHAFSCALSSYGALRKFREHLRSKSCS